MASASAQSVLEAKVPRLASASGSGSGAPHALWRPQMQTFLMRQGVEERDYAKEIPHWRVLSAAVQADAEAEEQEAFALLLGGAAASSDSRPSHTATAACCSPTGRSG